METKRHCTSCRLLIKILILHLLQNLFALDAFYNSNKMRLTFCCRFSQESFGKTKKKNKKKQNIFRPGALRRVSVFQTNPRNQFNSLAHAKALKNLSKRFQSIDQSQKCFFDYFRGENLDLTAKRKKRFAYCFTTKVRGSLRI